MPQRTRDTFSLGCSRLRTVSPTLGPYGMSSTVSTGDDGDELSVSAPGTAELAALAVTATFDLVPTSAASTLGGTRHSVRSAAASAACSATGATSRQVRKPAATIHCSGNAIIGRLSTGTSALGSISVGVSHSGYRLEPASLKMTGWKRAGCGACVGTMASGAALARRRRLSQRPRPSPPAPPARDDDARSAWAVRCSRAPAARARARCRAHGAPVVYGAHRSAGAQRTHRCMGGARRPVRAPALRRPRRLFDGRAAPRRV